MDALSVGVIYKTLVGSTEGDFVNVHCFQNIFSEIDANGSSQSDTLSDI